MVKQEKEGQTSESQTELNSKKYICAQIVQVYLSDKEDTLLADYKVESVK